MKTSNSHVLEAKDNKNKLQDHVTFTYEEVKKATLEYFDYDELAADVFIDKYALKDNENNLYELTPNDMHWRMAKEFGRIEEKFANHSKLNGNAAGLSEYGQTRENLTTEKIYELFKNFKYVIPQGSVMSVLGNPFTIASLSNCIVLPELHDSYGGICYADQQLAQLFKRRCGVGLDISNLRPEGTSVKNSARTTSGAVSFMHRYSNTTREVAQSSRRGALMITIDIAHPDVEDFVKIKQDLTKVTGANVSIQLTDEFMQAVKEDKEYTHKWPIDSDDPTITKTVRARDLWKTIVECAHNTAEPGLIFKDRQHKYSPSSIYPQYKNITCNPCSEIMMNHDSCRLMALNLYGFVDNPFTKKAKFNYEKFYKTTYEAQRLMDDLVELELEAIEKILTKLDKDPEPEHIKAVEKKTWKGLYDSGRKGRRTGLGYTAHADMLAALGCKYDSEKAFEITEDVMKTKCHAEFDSSIDMAIERGKFYAFDQRTEKNSEFVQMLEKELPEVWKRMMQYGRRNVSISTVAPTGSLSILAQTSSGIEPVYLLSYKRNKKVNPNDSNVRVDFVDATGDSWQTFDVYHPRLKEYFRITGNNKTEKSPYFGSTAPEIDWLKRVKMQSIVQKYVTHSISSTINLPKDVPVDKVGEIYLTAWNKGLKGITVYRDGARSGVLTSVEERKKEKHFEEHHAPKRSKELECDVIRFQNGGEKWIGFVGLYEDKPYEIFTGLAEAFKVPYSIEKGIIKRVKKNDKSQYNFVYFDKDGNENIVENLNKAFNKKYWNYAKMISGVLRHGMPLPYVIDLIYSLHLDSDLINTWKNGVARTLKRYIADGTKATDKTCLECNAEDSIVYQEGCLTCKNCGSSKCS